jgi:Tfp pilus assembly protein PilV
MHTRRPAGFTLIEVLIAIVLIDFALLAIVGASATLLQRETELRARRFAARSASNRLSMLAASGCGAAQGTANLGTTARETWTALPAIDSVRELRDSVSFLVRGVTHTVVLATRTPC